jgi:hypothetical protein
MTDGRGPDRESQTRRLRIGAALTIAWCVVVFILIYSIGGRGGIRSSLPVAGSAVLVTWVALFLTGRLMKRRKRREQERETSARSPSDIDGDK